MNKEFLKMQKLAGIITESQYKKRLNENTFQDKMERADESKVKPQDLRLIDDVIKKHGYEVTDLQSLFDEMDYTDLVDSVVEEMYGLEVGQAPEAPIDQTNAAVNALLVYGKKKYGNRLNENTFQDKMERADESKVKSQDLRLINNVINKHGFEITDLQSLFDEMEYSDLIDAVVEEMYGLEVGQAPEVSIDQTNAAVNALLVYGKKKYGNRLNEKKNRIASTKLNENTNGLKVKWTPKYYQAIEDYGDEAYDEKGLADGFTMKNGKKVKEIIGYYVPEDANNSSDEEFDIIGYIYSTSGKDIESYSEDELDDAFNEAL